MPEPLSLLHPYHNESLDLRSSEASCKMSAPGAWPPKYDVIGVGVSATNYDEVEELVTTAAHERRPAVVSFFSVHSVVTASRDPELRDVVNKFDIVASDGQPVRWALNWLYGVGLTERVYGPETMLRVCRRAAAEGIAIYLYGSTPDVLARLEKNLTEKFTGLRIAGVESPPFRDLTPEEEDEVVARINGSGAGIVFIGLGCPKQDWFAGRFRDRLQAVLMCVGAAFDFHAGTLPQAPPAMQKRGLEWLYRLIQEPRRLWRRYLLLNPLYLALLARQWIGLHGRRACKKSPAPKSL